MKLHLGCGEKYIEGFIHVDLLEKSHIDYKLSIDNLNFAENDSVELIYASHVLEHFGRNDYMRVLDEWYRVLRPSGMLRVAVPDFRSIILQYIENNNLQEILGLLIGGQKDIYGYHKMIFDEALLVESLKITGFNHISRYNWRDTEHSHIDDYSQAYLPHMEKEAGKLMSLNIEAIK